MLVKRWSNGNFYVLLMGGYNGITGLENDLESSSNAEDMYVLEPTDSTPRVHAFGNSCTHASGHTYEESPSTACTCEST